LKIVESNVTNAETSAVIARFPPTLSIIKSEYQSVSERQLNTSFDGNPRAQKRERVKGKNGGQRQGKGIREMGLPQGQKEG